MMAWSTLHKHSYTYNKKKKRKRKKYSYSHKQLIKHTLKINVSLVVKLAIQIWCLLSVFMC